MIGHVKWFNEGKGFGFIHAEGKDYFVHFRSIQTEGFKSLTEGQKVSFVVGNNAKGDYADKIVIEDNGNQ